MKRNLYMSRGAIAAEPLYLLLEKHGHTSAHEAVKVLAHEALAKQLPLHEIVQRNKKLTPYWKKFSRQEQFLIKSPEASYTGLAGKKALAIHAYWHKQLNRS